MSSLRNNADNDPPGLDELEMTVFGPGVGECIVLHLGNNDWIIVDSCMLPTDAAPVALQYLNRIRVDASRNVRWVIATHWHDDHIAGLAKILKECATARFAMSAALSAQQFVQLVLEVDDQNRLVKHSSSASELAGILEVLKSRGVGPYVVGPSAYAQDGSRLFQGGYDGSAEVWALSPSAATVTNASANLAERLLTQGDSRRFKRFSPNDLSVAILVKAGGYSLLHGADLENTVAAEFGWKAVLGSALRPNAPAQGFKVAHHGSQNAHHDDIWRFLLVPRPIALLTPYAKLRNPLPTENDVQRVKGLAAKTYCTTWPPSTRPPRRRGVDGIVGGATRARRAVNRSSGHIRLRLKLTEPLAAPRIELFGNAREM